MDIFFETNNVEQFCSDFNSESKKYCYRGATDIYLFRNIDSSKRLSDLCSNIQSEQEKSICLGNPNTFHSI